MNPRIETQESRKWLGLARAVVAHHLGGPAQRIVRQAGGISNLVYRVKHQHGEFSLKLSHDEHKLDVFRKEQFATGKARAVGVPTAEVLFVGNEAVPYPYMIQAWVPGRIGMHHPERLKILRQVGRYGALINSIAMPGFGRSFSSMQEAPLATWVEFLHEDLELERRLQALLTHGMLRQDKIERLRALLEGAGPDARGYLCHGDLRLKNVLADQHGEITAIIDWEHSVSALAPHWEWSIALHDLSVDAMEAFLAGYGASPERIDALSPVIKALNILNYAPAIEHFIRRHDRERLDWIRSRLSGALDLYSV